MYLITISTPRNFNAAKALADALEYGRLTEPAKAWSVVGMAISATDARIMAQAVANDRNTVVEVRIANISSGSHYDYTKVEPQPKLEPKPEPELVILGGEDMEWEPYDGVPADTLPPPNLEADTF